MNIEKMREEFEAWVKLRASDTPSSMYPQLLYRNTLDPDGYMMSWVDCAWMGWQASRAALVIELGPLYFDGNGRWQEVESIDKSSVMKTKDVVKAIEAAGVKVGANPNA